MTDEVRFSIDTNILFYSVDNEAGRKFEISKKVLLQASELNCVLTVQAISEFYHSVTRKNVISHSEAGIIVNDLIKAFEIAVADQTTILIAMEILQNSKLSFWDSMLLATVGQADCRVLISEDMQSGQEVQGVRIINPFHHKNGHRTTSVGSLLKFD